MPVGPIPYVKCEKLAYVADAAALDAVVPNSEFYTTFLFQVVGFPNGTTFTIKGSLDGTTFTKLDDANFDLPNPHMQSGAGSAMINVATYVPFKGGLKITANQGGASAGTIIVMMAGNQYLSGGVGGR